MLELAFQYGRNPIVMTNDRIIRNFYIVTFCNNQEIIKMFKSIMMTWGSSKKFASYVHKLQNKIYF